MRPKISEFVSLNSIEPLQAEEQQLANNHLSLTAEEIARLTQHLQRLNAALAEFVEVAEAVQKMVEKAVKVEKTKETKI